MHIPAKQPLIAQPELHAVDMTIIVIVLKQNTLHGPHVQACQELQHVQLPSVPHVILQQIVKYVLPLPLLVEVRSLFLVNLPSSIIALVVLVRVVLADNAALAHRQRKTKNVCKPPKMVHIRKCYRLILPHTAPADITQ